MHWRLRQAMGRALLLGLERGRHASAPFLLCRQLAGGSDFAVLTRRQLLCISAPSQTAAPTLRWAVALEDLFHIRRPALWPHSSPHRSLPFEQRQGLSCPAAVPRIQSHLCGGDQCSLCALECCRSSLR